MKKIKIQWLIFATITLAMMGCGVHTKNDHSVLPLLDSSKFISFIEGKKVGLFHIKNKNNVSAFLTNFGGRIIGLNVPDKNGQMKDVVLGFNSLAQYLQLSTSYYGATIGRYGNRIAKGAFKIDGQAYQAPVNNGVNMLHGGTKGYQFVVWDVTEVDESTLQFSYLSKDQEMGFPGNLNVKVTYQLTDENALKITYEATTDKKTVVNLTNHAFFNLNGEGSGSVLGHQLKIFAKQYLPVDSTMIPTGKLVKVANTPFDFTKSQTIGKRIETVNEQLKYGKGYDHNFVLDEPGNYKHAAQVVGDRSGIVMDIYTDQPGLQFYSGNFMKGLHVFKGGARDDNRTAFCLETQHFPDSPNQPNFPSTELKVGDTFKSVSYFRFTTAE